MRALGGAVLLGGAFDALVAAVGWQWWLLLVPVVLVVAAVPLGYDRYRSLGHTYVAGYVVSRLGSLVRRRTALATDGVIGWNLRSTFFQRRLGLTTLAATTAAGRQAYHVSDVATADAVRFADGCVPGLLGEFLA